MLSKPAGLLSVPGKAPEHADCLETRAKEQFPGSLLVHRLDMDTSGIFVMAMNKAAQANLGKQFERRKVQKTYIARVWGVPEEREGCVDLPLRCNWENRPLQMVCHEHGRLSQTDWRIIEHSASPLLRAQRSNPECPGMDGRVGSDDPSRNDEIFKISRVELKPLTNSACIWRRWAIPFWVIAFMLMNAHSMPQTASNSMLKASRFTTPKTARSPPSPILVHFNNQIA